LVFEELSFCDNKFVDQGYEFPTRYHEGTDSYYFSIEFIWVIIMSQVENS
jgi:hypothetical protein